MAAARKASLRLAALAAAALAVLGPTSAQAGSRPVSGPAVTGLHAFLYTANDPAQTTFPRTPAFAWNPVAGAAHYEFQLSTSNTFRDSGIIFEDDQVPGPAEAVNVPLPWITGSLYARVRAVLPKTLTPWSRGWAFTVRWTCASDPNKPCYPTPLDSSQPQYPGLIQWTPIDGATAYEVWYTDPDEKFFTTLTSADEREYYTLHQDAKWTGTVHWRVRALRDVSYGGTLNGLPTRSYGPWSPVYTSTNPSFAGGAITLNGTVTNGVFENGSGPAHTSMPAFVFSGNQGTDGATYELYRVDIYSDKDCLNRVFQGAMVGSPAYAPRSYDGPASEQAPFQDPTQYPPTLAFPGDSTALAAARNTYLPHGQEPGTKTYDDLLLPPATEAISGSAPDLATSGPAASSGSSGSGSGSGSDSGSGSSSDTGSASGSSTSTGASKTAYVPGAPIDIWDTDWPAGGYYWTVIPIRLSSKGAMNTTLAAFAPAGSTTLFLQDASKATPGSPVQIGNGTSQENLTIASVSGTGITLSAPLARFHAPGEPVISLGSSQKYQEAELPSETCTNFNRVQAFGKTSAPPQVTAASVPYVSGLSATGVKLLPAAQKKPTVYGVPLVSWAPIAGAGAYEVEWSKTSYPFKLEPNNPSVVTYSTSLLLGPRSSDGSVGPLSPGLWYYRVRGIDFSIAAGSSPASRRLSWSDPIPILVAKPSFKIVGGGTSVTTGKSSGSSASSWRRWELTDFALTLPKTWKQLSVKDTVLAFAAYDPALKGGYRTSVNVLAAGGRDTRTVAEWEQDLVAQAKRLTTGTIVHSVVTEPGGTAVYLEYHVPSGKKTVAVQQYVFDAGTKSYIVTFTTLAGLEKGYSATFASAARTFRRG